MASVKLLLLDPNEGLGTGLKAIREKEAELIDMTDYIDALSDATISSNNGLVIKDNIVYRITKTYFDLDKSQRILLASKFMSSYDQLPNIPTIIIPNMSINVSGEMKAGTSVTFSIDAMNTGTETDELVVYYKVSRNTDPTTLMNLTTGVLTIGKDETGELYIEAMIKDKPQYTVSYFGQVLAYEEPEPEPPVEP